MPTKRKILFVISTLAGGGAERALCNLTCGLPNDIEADILVNYETDKDYPHKANVISLGLPQRKSFSVAYQLIVAIYRCITLKKLKAQGGYDSCVSFMDSANIANILSGKKYCKVILSERIELSSCTSAGYRYIVQPMAKLLYSKADFIVCLSKGVESDLVKNFRIPKERTLTIYNGYNIASIRKNANELNPIELEKDKFYFITVGRLCEQKGQWHLIQAFREVARSHPESRLIICGEGPYSTILQELVSRFKIDNKVIFAGFQRNPFAIVCNCHTFVFPSMYEGFGNVMIENMALGLPVIATDYRSGAREILAPNTDFKKQQVNNIEFAEYGILVPVCNTSINAIKEELEPEEKLMAKAMNRLIEDTILCEKYKKQSVKRANDFSVEKTVEQWLKL